MLKIPLTEQDLLNVKDEYALVMDIWKELERLANSFTQECTDIQNGYKARIEQMSTAHAAQADRMNKEHSQKLSALEYERSSALEQWETRYKNEQRETNQKKEDARRVKDSVEENSSKYRSDMKEQIRARKKQLQDYLMEINEAESKIKAKRYLRVAKKVTEPVEMNVDSLEQLMCKNPKLLATEINELDEELFKKLIRPTLLKTKCVEFFSLKCKAQQLYDKEIKEQDAIMPDADRKACDMVSEAMKRMQSELRELDASADEIKHKYAQYCLELEQAFDNRRKELLTKQTQAENELKRRQQSEKETVTKNRQTSLVEALKKYQSEQIYHLPPQVLKKYVDLLMARKIYKADGFTTAQVEPLNITVGYIYFKFDQFLENKIVKQFMTKNYGFILKNGCFVLPYTVAINESLALCYKYNNKMAEAAKQDMQTLCLNAFLSTPPNKMRFHFIDPLKSGQSFAMFKHFEDENSSSYNIRRYPDRGQCD